MSKLLTLPELGERIAAAQGAAVIEWCVAHQELTVSVKLQALVDVVTYLRDDSQCLFRQLTDICGVDYPQREARFDVVYHLLSTKCNRRIRLKVAVGEMELVPSLTALYPAAGWYEREVWDMYGVGFSGNPDLRRILTDYGFDGYPLRKDFPLTGHVEMRYDAQQGRVVYEPVRLAQEFRSFDYPEPWSGPKGYVLPGDEKAGAA